MGYCYCWSIPDEIWHSIRTYLPTVRALAATHRRWLFLWPVTITRDCDTFYNVLIRRQPVQDRLMVRVPTGIRDLSYIRMYRTMDVPSVWRKIGPQCSMSHLLELSIHMHPVTEFTRDTVQDLTYIFEGVAKTSVRSIAVYAPNTCHTPTVSVDMPRDRFVIDLYVKMVATMVHLSGPSLRCITIDMRGQHMRAPYIKPVVDAIAKHTGVSDVVIILPQIKQTGYQKKPRCKIHVLEWIDIEKDIQRLAWDIPHLHSLYVDCSGMFGIGSVGRSIEMHSHLKGGCVIIGGHSIIGKRRGRYDW